MKKVRIALATAAFAFAFAGVFASASSSLATIQALGASSTVPCLEDTVDDVCTLTAPGTRCTTITNSLPAFKFNAQTNCNTAIYRQ
jgi:hypothetical protein